MNIVYDFTFVNEKDALATQFDGNFNKVATVVNGNIEDANIKTGAAIQPAKILGTALVASDPSVAATANTIPKRDGNGDLTIKKLIGTSGTPIELVGLGSDVVRIRPSNVSAANGLIIDEDGGNFISFATGQVNGFLFSDDVTFSSPVFTKVLASSTASTLGRVFTNSAQTALNLDLGSTFATVFSAETTDVATITTETNQKFVSVNIGGTVRKLAIVE